MEIFLDSCLAMLAAFGIWSLCKLFFDAWMNDYVMWVAICAKGNALELERVIHWQRRRARSNGIVLVDCGLNECGKSVVNLLAQREQKVWVYPLPQGDPWVKEAEQWMKIGEKMK